MREGEPGQPGASGVALAGASLRLPRPLGAARSELSPRIDVGSHSSPAYIASLQPLLPPQNYPPASSMQPCWLRILPD